MKIAQDKFLRCLIIFLLTISAWGWGADFYVATSGDNKAGDGSLENPWRTIAHGLSKLKPGDTLFVRGGVYEEESLSVPSGTAGSPVTVKAYPGEIPILCGAAALTGWQQCTDTDDWLDGKNADYANIFRVRAESRYFPPRLVLENDEQIHLARYPKQELAFVERVHHEEASSYDPADPITFLTIDPASDGATDHIIDTKAGRPTEKPDDFWIGGTIRLHSHAAGSWVVPMPITGNSQSESKIFFDSTGTSMEGKTVVHSANKDSYAIANHPHVLSSPGEYGYAETTEYHDEFRFYDGPNETQYQVGDIVRDPENPDQLRIALLSNAWTRDLTSGRHWGRYYVYHLYVWPSESITSGKTTQQIIDALDSGIIRVPVLNTGFYVTYKEHFVIDGFHIRGFYERGIQTRYAPSNGIAVRNCVVEDCGNTGIAVSAVSYTHLTLPTKRIV